TRLHGDGLLLDCAGGWEFAADVSTVWQPHPVASPEGPQARIPNHAGEGRGGGTFHRSRGRDRSLAGDFRGGGEERCEAFVCRARFGRPSRHGESSNQLPEPAEDWVRTVESRASPSVQRMTHHAVTVLVAVPAGPFPRDQVADGGAG